MSVTTRESADGQELWISISGTFDFNLVQEFRKSYEQDKTFRTYVLDMSQVDHIDSSALGMLLNMKKTVGETNRVVIKNCKPAIKKIFLISRFDKKFDFE